MKIKTFRVLSLFFVVLTLAGILSLPAFAYSYPMDYTITYKTTDGTVLGEDVGQIEAEDRDTLSIVSPSFSGYLLQNSSDSTVTGSMVTWNFPTSNYDRHGTGSYTVYYEKAYSMTVRYLYGSSMRTAAASKSSTGKSGSRYFFTSPTVAGYSPNKTSVSGRYDSVDGYDTVYYYENSYTISFNANGGSGAPSDMTKMHFTSLTLPATKPTRTGYSFMGWATDSSASSVAYLSGGTYSENGDTTLYAVWSPNIYTVKYDANGGSGAPSSQTKTFGQNITLSTSVPSRNNYVFIGWATQSDSTAVIYESGEVYTADENITLYAVWQEYTCDFSVSELTVSPEEAVQYGKVTVRFRLDSWDKNLPYDNIPVEVLLNGEVIYSETVNFDAYGVQNFVFTLNVGVLEGTQTLAARVNWADHESETRTDNNFMETAFIVNKLVETSVEAIDVSGEYTEGTQVITSFYAVNEGSSDIMPEDNMTFEFLVYTLENSTVKTVSQQTRDNVVIPANGRNLVYFKWNIPADSAGTTYYCKGSVSHDYADKEQNSGNNVTEFAVIAQGNTSSQTPNTRFEKNPPAGYSANVNPPTTKAGSATWNMWVSEDGNLVLKSYGVTVTGADPVAAPSSACKTAEKIGETWKMKSGYGITLNWHPALVAKAGYTMPESNAYTGSQNVYATFPEFGYSTSNEKYRTLESVGGAYQFISNSDADKNERIHFIPVYVGDGNYTVSVTATQIWTPAGMISDTRSANTIVIDGTMYDDLYVGER